MQPRYKGLDPADPATTFDLDAIQAVILKGHGRAYQKLIFVTVPRLPHNQLAAKKWLATLRVSSASDQLKQIHSFKSNRKLSSEVLVSVYLSAAGFIKLDIPKKFLPRDIAFRDGMKYASVTRLSETTSKWNKEFKNEIHFAVSLSCNSESVLQSNLDELIQEIRPFASSGGSYFIENLAIKRDSNGKVIEHFGFSDGISQPLFFKSEIDLLVTNSYLNNYDPTADPYQLVLVSEAPHFSAYGSYLTIRKISQDISGFNNDIELLAALSSNTESVTGMLTMGRSKDGLPLSTTGSVYGVHFPNDFDYSGDHTGIKCPLQSHIRRANPRQPKDFERRIARRGMTYQSNTDTGLMFMAFQADILRQFEFIQSKWANSVISSENSSIACGIDPISGFWSSDGVQPHRWPSPWNGRGNKVDFPFGNHTTMRGGEYFYAPSLKMLRSLGV